ncbi:MAG: hypothetical protein J6X71_01655 [Bacteroidales bacterium]|nr:hypothetical protein [Bacteroidales bacterium]
MRIKSFILAAAALLTLALSCEPKKPVLGVSVDPKALAFTADGGTQTVQATSADTWTVTVPESAKEWLQVSPLSGSGTSTVQFTASANNGKPRSVSVSFTSGIITESVAVTQEGKQKASDGKTPETAFSASEAYEWVMSNIGGNNEPSPEKMYVRGFIHKIAQYQGADQYFTGNSYGNASFYMSDSKQFDSDKEKDFEAYQVNYLGNRAFKSGTDKDIAIGDEVIIYGHLTKYNSTAETMGKGDAYIYSLNGVVEEEHQQTEITASTVADFIKNADPSTIYRLTGKVSAFKTGTNSSGKNYMQFNLKDDTGTILVYGFNDGEYEKWADTVKDGGTVVLTGVYQYYEKNTQHEVVKATIESFEPGQAQTEITSATVADFIKSDGATYYRLSGVISGFTTGTNSSGKNYMQFNLTDATGTILVYGFKDGEYDKWADKLADYGKVTLTGTYEYYSSKQQHEVMNTTIETYEDGVPPTEFEQLTVAEFIAKANPSTQYRLAGVVEDYKITNQEAGYMEFYLKDDTGRILIYSLADGEFDKWSEKLADGGNIVLVGSYNLYNNTPEVVKATVESFEANPDYKYCRVSGADDIKLPAAGGEAEFKVIANAAWTATSDNPAFTVTPASGNTDATVKVSVSANEGTTPRTANITVKCPDAGAEIKVVVVQSKPSSGQEVTIAVDFTKEMSELPQGSSSGKTDGTYTWGGETFTIHAADKFYQAKSGDNFYLLIGKANSYIIFPGLEGKSLVKVAFKTGAGASENVICDIAKDSERLNVNTGKMKKGTEYEWEISGEPGVAYRLVVTNAYNAQFQNLTLYYE